MSRGENPEEELRENPMELSSDDEMGCQEDHGGCEHPGCVDPAIETWYCMNPEPPPVLLRASLCLTHHEAAPEDQEQFAHWVMGIRQLDSEQWKQHVD